jgi:hypothetical protein
MESRQLVKFWHFLSMILVLFCCVSIAVLPSCQFGGGKVPQGGECQISDDCEDGLECRAKRCKTPLPNNPPVAIVRVEPANATVGQKVELDGSNSRDPENQSLRFRWNIQVPTGSKAQLNEIQVAKTYFIPDMAGNYNVVLTVDDGTHKAQSPEFVINVVEGQNIPPIAKAGDNRQLELGSMVTLDGSGSEDPDGDNDLLSFRWEFRSIPTGSRATLEQANTARPSFVSDVAGRYIIALTVTDVRGANSDPATVTIEAIPDIDKVPTLISVTPNSGVIESLVSITINGENFAQGITATIADKPFVVTFVDSKQLKAQLNLTGFTQGNVEIRVINPNRKVSNAINFQIIDIPIPELTRLIPTSAAEGSRINLVIEGKNFIDSSEVIFQTTPLKTVYKSATRLEADLDLRSTLQGEYNISVRNPGGRVSKNKLIFKVIQPGPPPVLNVLNPPSGQAGEKIDFSVHGSGFEEGAVIIFDSKEIPSKRIRRDEIQADPKLDLSPYNSGDYQVWVRNPDNQLSGKENFSVIGLNPVPQITRILPFNLYIGTKLTLSVEGQRFAPTAEFFIGAKSYPINAARRSDQYLEVLMDMTQGSWTPGNADAYVLNPSNQKSNVVALTITHVTPIVDSITPSGWNTQCDTEVMILGSNFFPVTKVHLGSMVYEANPSNQEFKLNYVSDKKLTFKLLKKNVTATTYKLHLINGPGAQSPSIDFKISSGLGVPVIQSVRPSSAASDTITRIVIDDNYSEGKFFPGAYVELNGVKQPTSCDLSYDETYCYELRVDLDLLGVLPGKYTLYVLNPCDRKSLPQSFVVTDPPEPYISAIEPPFVRVGDTPTLKIKGVNFTKSHSLYIGSLKVDSVFNGPDEIVTKDKINFSYAQPSKISIRIEHANGKKTPNFDYSIIAANHALTISAIIPKELKRGQSHKKVIVMGSGFTQKTTLSFNNQNLNISFDSPTQLTIAEIDFTTIKTGIYPLQATDGNTKSNIFSMLAAPLPPPIIRYLSPEKQQVGTANRTIYIYGNEFCPSGTCPSTARPTVIITGENNTDYSSRFNVTSASNTSVYGPFDIQGLKVGDYLFSVRLPTGEVSNPSIFKIEPSPPPIANSVSPLLTYRGNAQQLISISGSNFINGDVVIFNNEILNSIPPTSVTSSQISAYVNLSTLKYAGEYPLYVLRCDNPPTCNETRQSAEVKLNVQDPPCPPRDCAQEMLPTSTEACADISGKKICRPKCTTNQQCTALKGAPTNAKCTGGFCQ